MGQVFAGLGQTAWCKQQSAMHSDHRDFIRGMNNAAFGNASPLDWRRVSICRKIEQATVNVGHARLPVPLLAVQHVTLTGRVASDRNHGVVHVVVDDPSGKSAQVQIAEFTLTQVKGFQGTPAEVALQLAASILGPVPNEKADAERERANSIQRDANVWREENRALYQSLKDRDADLESKDATIAELRKQLATVQVARIATAIKGASAARSAFFEGYYARTGPLNQLVIAYECSTAKKVHDQMSAQIADGGGIEKLFDAGNK